MSKAVWSFLLIFSSILALTYGTMAGIALWNHLKYSVEIPIQSVEWETFPRKGLWTLKGTYTYRFASKNFIGTDVLPKPYYLNLQSAEKEIEALKGMRMTIWLDAKHPESSVLYNSFPLKKVVYALCLIGVCLYFVYLKFHVELLSSKL